MGILQKAVNEQAFLKCGIFGFAGSGKTYTASMLAIAIAKKLQDKKPVAFFDTETGSDFLIPRFEAEGVELLRVKSLSLADLMESVKEAEKACSCMIVDSATHIWRDVIDSYMKRKNITRMEFHHWNEPKRLWGNWNNYFLNSKLHIIVCGRAGYEYDYEKDDEGKKQLIKTGTKMKSEGEFGYEPSLVLEMEREQKGATIGSGWNHCAHVLKDRTDMINGKKFVFSKPGSAYKKGDFITVYKAFEPVINCLNLGGNHLGLDTSRSNEVLFEGPEGRSRWEEKKRRAAIALEEIQASIVALWPGQSAAEKKIKADALQELFETRSWVAVEGKTLVELERAVFVLRELEELYKSRDNKIKEGALEADQLSIDPLAEMRSIRASLTSAKNITEAINHHEAVA